MYLSLISAKIKELSESGFQWKVKVTCTVNNLDGKGMKNEDLYDVKNKRGIHTFVICSHDTFNLK